MINFITIQEYSNTHPFLCQIPASGYTKTSVDVVVGFVFEKRRQGVTSTRRKGVDAVGLFFLGDRYQLAHPGRQLRYEAGRIENRVDAVAVTRDFRTDEDETVAGPCDGDIEKSPFLLFVVHAKGREPSFGEPDDEDGTPLDTFGLVNRRQREHLVRRARDCVLAREIVEQGDL